MPNYTNDWFGNSGLPNFSQLTHNFRDRPVQGLEIGSFEGRSSNWIVENWCAHEGSRLTCVDPFTGNVENPKEECVNLYERFIDNTRENSGKIRVLRRESLDALTHLLATGELFDFAYVDGDRHNLPTLVDGILVDRMLRPGGVIIFDDYGWGPDLAPYDRPREAIEYFFTTMGDRYQVVGVNWQVVAVKLR